MKNFSRCQQVFELFAFKLAAFGAACFVGGPRCETQRRIVGDSAHEGKGIPKILFDWRSCRAISSMGTVVRHGCITCVARMDVIAAVIASLELFGMRRVTQSAVKSITPSNAWLERIELLTAVRIASRSGGRSAGSASNRRS